MAALALGLALVGGPAQAKQSDDDQCGSTAHEAVAAAEKALAEKPDPKKQTAALNCLVQAVKRLDAAQIVVKRGADDHAVMHPPQLPGGPGKPEKQ